MVSQDGNSAREWLHTKHNSFIYIFKTVQIIILGVIAMTVFLRTEMKHGQIQDGGKYYGALFFSLLTVMFNGMAELAMTIMKLPVFFKQRDFLFYLAWAFALPIWILKIPLTVMESGLWIILTYYTIGFAPSASRFFRQFLAFLSINQMALALFRFIAAVGRTMVIANTLGTFAILMIFVLGGYLVSKGLQCKAFLSCFKMSLGDYETPGANLVNEAPNKTNASAPKISELDHFMGA